MTPISVQDPTRRQHEQYPHDDGGGSYRGSTVEDDRSIDELASDLTSNAQQLIRCEVELARIEMVAELKAAARGAALAGAAAVVGLVTLGLLAHTVALALAEGMDPWLAYLITTVLFGAIAGVLGAVGIKKLRETNPVPEKAIDKTKEDVSWLKTHT